MKTRNVKPAPFKLLVLFVLILAGVPAQSIWAADWVLTWSDEFAGPAGQSPDPVNWDYDIGTDWGNAQLEYDTDRPSNVSLDGNGNLVITAREESYMGQPYTSARIVTRGRYEPTYGRIEARIKLPTGQGLWPAFWLLGTDISTVGWPQCGEIDIMEYRGQEPNVVLGSLHGPGYFAGGSITDVYVLNNDRFDTAFHTFSVEWEPGVIRWYVDSVLYHSVSPADLGGLEWVFDHPFYIILNVAVGGNFVGPPDGSTVFPQTMEVDYVRVYRDASIGETCCVRRGDLNDDGSLTASDIIFLVNYVFKGGLAPQCLKHGDSNDDSTVTSSDIVFLVNHVFKGGAAPVACPVTGEPVPTTTAPAPTVDPGDVISLFSDTYSDVPVNTWSAVWDQADVEDYLIGSDQTKKYTNLVFAGIEFLAPTVDASAVTHFHMDVWTPDPTDAPAVFRVKLVDFGANGVFDGGGDDVEHELTFDENTMDSESWVSIDVPLASFVNLTTRAHLAQLIISGDPNTVYVDNIYLYNAGLPGAPSVPAPTPTLPQADVISLFSDAYTNVSVDTWSAAWDLADVQDFLVGADSTKKYTNLVFAGIDFGSSVIDATAMTHFHMDVWTPDPTDAPSVFKVKLVDFGADGVFGGGDDVEHEITLDENTMNTGSWVSLELPLADFTSLTTRAHLAQLLISGDPNTVFIDNVYLHK